MYDSSKNVKENVESKIKTDSGIENLKHKNQEILKLPYITLVVCLLLTVGVTYLSYTTAINKDKLRFNSEISEIKEVLKSKMTSYETLLKATKGFLETNESTDRRKFAGFIKSFNLEKDYGGVQGIGYTVKVIKDEREDFIEKIRQEGISNFQMFPNQNKDEYQAVIYLEPTDFRNKRAIGFDMSSEALRAEAMSKARDFGKAFATGKITLLQEIDKDIQPGFIVYLPVYETNEMPETLEEKRLGLKGYIYGAFRAGDFLNDITNSISDKEVGVLIYDKEVSPNNLLAESQPGLINDQAKFETVEINEFAGRNWRIVYKSLPALINKTSIDFSIPILIAGIVLSLFIFLLTYLEAASRLRYQIIAENLTISEKEKAELFEREQIARKQAERSVKAKDAFISTVSHELRTPLNAISGWTRILRGERISSNTKERALKTIENNIQTQSNLIEELLDFSQIASGKEIVNMIDVNFTEAFEHSINQTLTEAKRKNIELKYKNSLNSERIKGNQRNIEKVFSKILQNAIKFTPENGKIKATIKAENNYIKFTVNDSGRGINKEYLDKVFDNFSQEDTSTTRKHGGFGLGLTYSQHVIKQHGGEMNIISEGENKGTTLIIKFPFENNGKH
ncbi:MAG: CHASE domain-containing protein [Aridibacter sp.]